MSSRFVRPPPKVWLSRPGVHDRGRPFLFDDPALLAATARKIVERKGLAGRATGTGNVRKERRPPPAAGSGFRDQ